MFCSQQRKRGGRQLADRGRAGESTRLCKETFTLEYTFYHFQSVPFKQSGTLGVRDAQQNGRDPVAESLASETLSEQCKVGSETFEASFSVE